MPKDVSTTTETESGKTTVEEKPQTETTTTVNKPAGDKPEEQPIEPVKPAGGGKAV